MTIIVQLKNLEDTAQKILVRSTHFRVIYCEKPCSCHSKSVLWTLGTLFRVVKDQLINLEDIAQKNVSEKNTLQSHIL